MELLLDRSQNAGDESGDRVMGRKRMPRSCFSIAGLNIICFASRSAL